ncbi:MAG TPA: response regulator transcription factor [Pseudonocardia sp.]|nr:response regulator transcription factor [Pseudonocardia sp.]
MSERRAHPVLIVDSHELFRTTLYAALRARGLDAHEAPLTDRDAVLADAARLDTAVVVLALSLTLGHGDRPDRAVDLVPALRQLGHHTVVLRGSHDDAEMAKAVAGGAIGSVTRSTPFEVLLRLVARATDGEPVMTEVERRHWLTRHRHIMDRQRRFAELTRRLSSREHEILRLLADGHGAAAIAERAGLPESTVRAEIRAILATLEVGSQLEAAVLMRDDPALQHILDGLAAAPGRPTEVRRAIR